MSVYFAEWLSFGMRWLHVVTGIAWIGSSFYFVALDLGLRRRAGLPEGVGGEAWQVHGGGFYHIQKYMVAPPHMPDELTWFKWESYATWLTGFAMLWIVYYAGAELYLIDRHVADLPVWGAVLIGIAGIGLGWVVYDRLCKSPLGDNDTLLFVALFVFIVAVSFGFSQVFSGRGAMIHTGALIATIMTANVFFLIIPNQTIVVDDLKAGRTPDPRLGKAAKQRSLHNNYLTLPVLFFMLANHYPLAFGAGSVWVMAGFILLFGAFTRHFFNTMHATGEKPWWALAVAAALFLAVVAVSAVRNPLSGGEAEEIAYAKDPEIALANSMHFGDAQNVVLSRCSMCHAREPLYEGVAVPPKDVVLETPDDIVRNAGLIKRHAVLSTAMPPGNVTEMEPEERSVLALWLGSAGL